MLTSLPAQPAESPTQQHYYELWCSRLASTNAPTQLAEQGGRLADRAAWVFVAGYQGAMRQCFPTLQNKSGWASYLVSEARTEKRVPTCVLASGNSNSGRRLNGSKNWVAAHVHLESLVVNASIDGQKSPATANLVIRANEAGVGLIQKPSGRFLPELLVGRAEFTNAVVDNAAVLPDAQTHAALFGLIEARCLLVAMGGHFAQLAPDAAGPLESLMLSSGLVTAELGQSASIDALLESMALLVEWFEAWHHTGQPGESAGAAAIRRRWSEDQRLLQMHRPLLLKSKEAFNS